MSELSGFVAQNLRDSATDGPNKGKYTETAPAQDLQKVVERNYHMPQNASESLQNLFGQINAEGTNPQTPEQRAKPGNRAAQIALKIAETSLPIGAGIAAREGLEAVAGIAGGPIVGALAGAVSGGISGWIKVKDIKSETGKGAKEFYQREVSGADRDLKQGNFIRKVGAFLSKAFNGIERITVEHTFKAGWRDAQIGTILNELNIEELNPNLFEQIEALIQQNSEENTPKLQRLLQHLMTQSTLTGFSNSPNEQTMVARMDQLSVITFAMANKGKLNNVEQACTESKKEVEQVIQKLKRNYSLASGFSRGMKSFLFLGALEVAREVSEKVHDHQDLLTATAEHFKGDVAGLESQLDSVNQQIADIKDQIETLNDFEPADIANSNYLEFNDVDIKDFATQHLIPAAKSAGFTENVQAYIEAGGPERMKRFESITQIYKELHSNPDTLQKVATTAKNIGFSNDQLLEALTTRAPYDLHQVTIDGVKGFDYQSIDTWLDQINKGGAALASVEQGRDIAASNLHSTWNTLWDGLIKEGVVSNTTVNPNLAEIDKLWEQSLALSTQGLSLKQDILNAVALGSDQTEVIKAQILALQSLQGGTYLYNALMTGADLWGSLYRGPVVFGDKYEGPRNVGQQEAPPLPNNNNEQDPPGNNGERGNNPETPFSRRMRALLVERDRVEAELAQGGFTDEEEIMQLEDNLELIRKQMLELLGLRNNENTRDLILTEADLPYVGEIEVPVLKANGDPEMEADGVTPKTKTTYYYTNNREVRSRNRRVGTLLPNGGKIKKLASEKLDHFEIKFDENTDIIVDPRSIAQLFYPGTGQNAQTVRIYDALKAKKADLDELSQREFTNEGDDTFQDEFIKVLGSVSYIGPARAQQIYGYLRNNYQAKQQAA